jgi:hypothetical protein
MNSAIRAFEALNRTKPIPRPIDKRQDQLGHRSYRGQWPPVYLTGTRFQPLRDPYFIGMCVVWLIALTAFLTLLGR